MSVGHWMSLKGSFKDDDLTGGTTLHRTNMMFVQPKKLIRKVFEELHKAVVNVREKLKQIVTVKNQKFSYQSAVRGKPQSFEPINISRGTTDLMKKKKKRLGPMRYLRSDKRMIFY